MIIHKYRIEIRQLDKNHFPWTTEIRIYVNDSLVFCEMWMDDNLAKQQAIFFEEECIRNYVLSTYISNTLAIVNSKIYRVLYSTLNKKIFYRKWERYEKD